MSPARCGCAHSCVISGATDAISFLALGGAFTSVMTGNLVLLGVSLGHADSGLARQIGAAVVGYIAGCAIGARITGTPVHGEPVWPTAVSRGLAVEAGLFVMYAAGWWAVGGRPGGAAEASLLGLSALALGIQSASVRRFGVTGLSTTYLTGRDDLTLSIPAGQEVNRQFCQVRYV